MRPRTKLTLLVVAGCAMFAAAVPAADAPRGKSMDAKQMSECVAREQERNNTGKAAAEVTCKELREVQQDSESTPAAKPAPSAPASDGASAAGHSSHSAVKPADTAAPAASAPAATKPAN